MNNAWDKFLLIGVAVAVLAVSGLFVSKAISFSKEFDRDEIVKSEEIPPTDLPRVIQANNFVKSTTKWELPMKGDPPKKLPLFKSIIIVEVDGKLIDMLSPSAELVRPPVSNEWLTNHGLDFLNAAVLSQDSDNDGFSNLEEWEAKTNPKDSEDHPPFTGKLYVKERKSKGYKIRFAATPDAESYQIIREPTAAWPRRETFIMKMGEISRDEQFRLDSFEKKEAVSKTGIKVDASVLHFTYMPTSQKFKMVRNIPTNIPTYFGVLSYDLGAIEPQFIKEGEAFTMSNDQKNKYRLLKIEADSAKISIESENGEEKIVEIGKKG